MLVKYLPAARTKIILTKFDFSIYLENIKKKHKLHAIVKMARLCMIWKQQWSNFASSPYPQWHFINLNLSLKNFHPCKALNCVFYDAKLKHDKPS